MFRRLSEPLPLSEASLLAMRPALNAPVLNVSFLPVGPARAALVIFAEEWGGIGFALGIRSNEGGQVAVFRNQVSIEADVALPDVLEPVLAEAEQMGFLFDEDMLEAQGAAVGREQAMALWGRLMGDIELPPPPRVVPKQPAATEPILDLPERPAPTLSLDELVLEDVTAIDLAEIAPELEDGVLPGEVLDERRTSALPRRTVERQTDLTQPTEPMPSAPDPAVEKSPASPGRRAKRTDSVPAQVTLSKFRHADAAVAAADGASPAEGGSELGRIPLVRIRREREGSKRVPYLARLLSSF